MAGTQSPISPSLQPCIDAARDELDAGIANARYAVQRD